MNEMDLLREIIKVAPALAILVWVVLRQEKSLDKIVDRFETQAKATTQSLDKATELQGRTLERLAHNEAHELRMGDIVNDYTDEKRRIPK